MATIRLWGACSTSATVGPGTLGKAECICAANAMLAIKLQKFKNERRNPVKVQE